MWIISGVGFLGSLLAFVLSFIPPAQIATGSTTVWYAVLFGGAFVVVILPFIIYSMRKPEWKQKGVVFEPFEWQGERK
jgi:phosphotransferase system  glucose/maltose/N-acetylglucosamine-specific IIC component